MWGQARGGRRPAPAAAQTTLPDLSHAVDRSFARARDRPDPRRRFPSPSPGPRPAKAPRSSYLTHRCVSRRDRFGCSFLCRAPDGLRSGNPTGTKVGEAGVMTPVSPPSAGGDDFGGASRAASCAFGVPGRTGTPAPTPDVDGTGSWCSHGRTSVRSRPMSEHGHVLSACRLSVRPRALRDAAVGAALGAEDVAVGRLALVVVPSGTLEEDRP